MKGMVIQQGERTSVVLYNNGKISEISTPPDCEEGMVITVSYNKRLILLLCVLLFAAVLCAGLFLRSAYLKPFGYVQINYGNVNGNANGTAAVELAYNRFRRILAMRPLNQQAVEPIAALSLNNAKLENAYEKIMLSYARSPLFPVRNTALVRIAQDNLAGAKSIEQSLSLLSAPLASAAQKEIQVSFELYTHELYREAMTAQSPEIAPMTPQDGRQQMRHGGQSHGMRNYWCW
jgi:hypothetical protein